LTVVPSLQESQHRLAAVAGTSTCHLIQSPKGIFVNGVWGPYRDAVFQGWWMNEGGQSSTGQLIEFILTTHPAYPALIELAKEQHKNIHTVLGETLEKLRVENNVGTLTELTKDMHMYPDFHGNRSPIADPRMRGSIVGLDLDSGLHDLARKFNIALEAIALQTKHIVEELCAKGHRVSSIYMSGGQTQNAALMQLLADVCGIPVVLPAEPSGAVVLGAAMLGRFAAETEERRRVGEAQVEQADLLWGIMVEMTPVGKLVVPAASHKERRLLEAKYRIFKEAIDIQTRWREEMKEAAAEPEPKE